MINSNQIQFLCRYNSLLSISMMKILLLCNNDLASLFAINLLRPCLLQHKVMIGQTSQVGAKQTYPQQIQALIEYEKQLISNLASENAKQFFKRLLVKQTLSITHSFAELVKEIGQPIHQLNQINSPQGIEQVKQMQPDLIISIRFGKILQQPIIEIPKLGVINLHSGLLPSYQGVMATFWAMLNGESKIGCCLHYIQDNQIDAGDIIQQSPIKTNFRMSYLENLLAIYIPGVKMIEKTVKQLQLGQPIAAKSQQGIPSYYGFPDSQAINRFSELGNRLF